MTQSNSCSIPVAHTCEAFICNCDRNAAIWLRYTLQQGTRIDEVLLGLMLFPEVGFPSWALWL